MKKLLMVLALVLGVATFSMASAEPASAMNKGELVDAIADGADLSKADAKRALDGFVSATESALKKGNSVQLIGFGSFSISKRAARTASKSPDLSARERGCLWLAGSAPAWLHGLFCTVTDIELIALMAKSDDGTGRPLSPEQLKIFLDRFKSVTTGQLVKRDFVDIEDFGVFIVEEGKGRNLNIVEFDDADSFAARVGRNPQTGKEIKIAANGKNVVKFKAGADLSKKVN
jgi:nucleoid DNA-binding protein